MTFSPKSSRSSNAKVECRILPSRYGLAWMTSISKPSRQRSSRHSNSPRMKMAEYSCGLGTPPHWLYQDLKNLISGQWSASEVAILYPQRLNLGRGGHHESAIGSTGPGTRWEKRPGDHHGAGR